MEEQKKICPMLSMAVEDGTWACEEDNCAWWDADFKRCAVKDIVRSLKGIIYELLRLGDRIGK